MAHTTIKPILDRAIRMFGEPHQLDKLAEECAEYQVALAHHKEHRKNSEQAMAEEIADVIICAWQARLILGAQRIDDIVDAKLARLVKRMDDMEDDLK